jgi:hypothetical protein
MMATGVCQMQKGSPSLVNGARVYFSGEKLMSLEQGLAMHTRLTERAPSARAAVVVASHTLSTPAHPIWDGSLPGWSPGENCIAPSPWPEQEHAAGLLWARASLPAPMRCHMHTRDKPHFAH